MGSLDTVGRSRLPGPDRQFPELLDSWAVNIDVPIAERKLVSRNLNKLSRRSESMKTINILAISLACLILAVSAFGQNASTGALTGNVTDSNGAAVAGAQVKIVNESNGEERTV